MRGQCIRSVWAKKRCDHAHSRPTLCYGVPRIFLTAPLSYDAVAFHLGQCESFCATENSQPVLSNGRVLHFAAVRVVAEAREASAPEGKNHG